MTRRPNLPLAVLALVLGILIATATVDGSGTPARHDSRFITEPQLEALLAASPWQAVLWPSVIRIARCESSLRDLSITLMDTLAHRVTLREDSRGLMQINVKAWPRLERSLDLFDPADNLIGAYVIYLSRGGSFLDWSCA